jgi:hypothetical protein
VPEDDAGDLRDGYRRDHFEGGCRPEQRFHALLVAERLGEFGRILPIGVGGARGQPLDEDLGWCAEQDDVIEAGVVCHAGVSRMGGGVPFGHNRTRPPPLRGWRGPCSACRTRLTSYPACPAWLAAPG